MNIGWFPVIAGVVGVCLTAAVCRWAYRIDFAALQDSEDAANDLI